MITFQKEDKIKVEEFKTILITSTLGERRPINNINTLETMLENANLIITARKNGKLIGIARSCSDFVFFTYLSDLAVDESYQNQGIGKELIKQTKLFAPKAKLILLSAPNAVDFYPKIGMTNFSNCFILDDLNELK